MATQPVTEPIPDLSIPTDVCPHCGRPRKSVSKRMLGISRSHVYHWMIIWECGSSVLFSHSRPLLTLSRECTTVDI